MSDTLNFVASSGNNTITFDASGSVATAIEFTGAVNQTGPAGANGVGVPTGGSTGQALVKNSGTNYDTGWGSVAVSPATFSTSGIVKQTVYNIKDYGAVGDGSTDDYTAINNCLTAASGGPVYLPPGNYVISHALNLSNNTILRGAGQGVTTIMLQGSAITNFNNAFLIQGTGTGCVVSDLTLDGNYANLTSHPGNYGGLLQVRNGWLVERVECKNPNWFRFWVNNVSNVTIRDILFNVTVGAGYDNIGGGDTNTNITIENCRWVSGLIGNPLDFTGSESGPCKNIKFIRNFNYSANNAYFEAVTNSLIEGNVFSGGGGITLKSDASYAVGHDNAVNPRNNTVRDNEFTNGGGIFLSYNVKGTTHLGGYNKLIGNKIIGANNPGIMIYPQVSTGQTDSSEGHDVLIGNHVYNSNQSNVSTYNYGDGIVYPSGINITKGLNYLLIGNVCIDDQVSPTQLYGISIGQTYQPSDITEPDNIIAIGNDVSTNKTGGINIVSTYTTNYTLLHNLGYSDVNTLSSATPYKVPVQVATTQALPTNTYSNGTSGVGATITLSNVNQGFNYVGIDGITSGLVVGDRILVKNEATAANNGIYVINIMGGAGVNGVATRVTDFDDASDIPGAIAFVEEGTVNAGTAYMVASKGPFVIGTDAINWTNVGALDATLTTSGKVKKTTVNVRDKGALGDGTTDDTAAFVAAALECDTTGGTIFVPIGTYIVSQFTISSRTILRGAGIGSVLKLKNSSNGFMILTRDTIASPTSYPHDHQVRDLYFDLNNTNNTTAAGAIHSTKNRNMIVENCSFVNFKGNCILMDGSVGNNIQPRLINNQLDMGDRNDGCGIKLDSGCYDSYIESNDIGRAWRGLIISNGGDGNHTVVNNWCWAHSDAGMYIYQSHNNHFAQNTQDQNYGTTANGAGMVIDGCNNVSILGNKASNNSWRDTGNIMGFGVIGTVNINSGIRVINASTQVRISNSIFSNPNGGQQYGIKAEGSSAVYYNNCTFTDQQTGNTNAITGATITSLDGSTSSITRSIVSITSSTTLGATAFTDYVALIGASGAPTMPTAVGNTNLYTLKNVHSTNKTVSTTSSQTIDGSTTITLTPNTSVDVISDNSNWQII